MKTPGTTLYIGEKPMVSDSEHNISSLLFLLTVLLLWLFALNMFSVLFFLTFFKRFFYAYATTYKREYIFLVANLLIMVFLSYYKYNINKGKNATFCTCQIRSRNALSHNAIY